MRRESVTDLCSSPRITLHQALLDRKDKSKTWVQLVQSAVCVTASNCVNAGKDFVATIRAVYSTVSLVVTVVTVVMSKIICRSWKRMKLREMARTLLLIQAVTGTSAHGTTTKNMDMANLYARMGPGKIRKNHFICFSRRAKFLPS